MMEAGYMYLDRDSTGSSGRLIERSQTGPARNNETDRSRRSGSQRLLPQNTAAGQEVVLAPTRLFHGASSTQASSTRSKSVYSQDDTRGSSIRSKSLYSQNDKSQAEGVASDLIDSGYHHQRNESLHVQWTQNDVTRMAGEIYDESIPAVYLSLLGFWICENNANYEMAKAHIRELSLDQGYSVNRINNVYLRELLVITQSARPPKAQEKIAGKAAPVVEFEPHADENSFDVIYFAKLEVLPSSLRKKPESAVKEDQTARPLPSPIGKYPPNTPDRPHPLSLKSRQSGKISATPNRSVSTPLMNRKRRGTMHIPQQSVAFEEVTRELSRLTTATTASSRNSTDTDDVFGITDKDFNRRSDPFDLMNALLALEGKEPVPDDEDLDYHHDGYELASSDASSRVERDTPYNPRTTSLQGPISKPLILNSAPTVKVPRSPTRYVYSAAPPSPAPAVAAPDPPKRSLRGKPKLRQLTSRWAQTMLFGRRPNLSTGDFYRPNLFPGPGRAQHALIEEDGEDDSSPAPAILSSPAMAQIRADFPIPLVSNPVSTLPMLVAAATSPSTNPVGLAEQIRTVLEATRARGNTLALENWKGMSCFEQAWRQGNEDLLISIFGSQDTQLEPEDVASVEAVAKECRANWGHWVVEVLMEEADIF
ncbi:hypothetical protein HBH50_143770 [Parastagonospora nodorum]|nr:hypothetical protein HBH50_143770 [Parastagonospora nodorum]KAH4086098.1 hypothetical protein HBH48_146230 [Parastagonospora nodorum]KAH5183961.1 hypothetical protein HBH76_142010 [Parastagonospora nodorum]KAH5311268.1 hypothetical protein HBI50_156500 [Parastagonospora nodorum]